MRTKLLKFRKKSLRFAHETVNDETGEVTATTTLKAVHRDTALRKSCAFADAIAARAAAMPAEG
jgi:acyl-CoA thioester hydrolase